LDRQVSGHRRSHLPEQRAGLDAMVADAKPPDVAGWRPLGPGARWALAGYLIRGRPERWHVAGLWRWIGLSRQHAGAPGRRGGSSSGDGWFPYPVLWAGLTAFFPQLPDLLSSLSGHNPRPAGFARFAGLDAVLREAGVIASRSSITILLVGNAVWRLRSFVAL
jgi:hypothetical protein